MWIRNEGLILNLDNCCSIEKVSTGGEYVDAYQVAFVTMSGKRHTVSFKTQEERNDYFVILHGMVSR